MGLASKLQRSRLFEAAWDRERAGDFDGAFALLAQANQLAGPSPGELVARHKLFAENIEWLFGPEVFRRALPGSTSRAPIFIVGLPRSGSTLIEQILATHPQVQGMGETTAFEAAAWGRYPFVGAAPARDHFKTMADDYLAAIRAEGWRPRLKPRFTDKQLANYACIGSIHLAFPRAVVLHSVRGALDTCLSYFRADFENADHAWISRDLSEIGAHYVRYRRIMDHWSRVLPGRIVEVRHERLVNDFPSEARRLLEVCGLRWHDGVLRFYENDRAVTTISREQVRRPIFRTSIGRWRRYESRLGPLLEALGPYADEA
jgi:hypothetical protein